MGMTVEKQSLVICKQPGRYIGWPTIYYQIDKPGEKTSLVGTFWRLPKAD